MSTEYRLTAPVAYASLIEAGCRRSNPEHGAEDNYHPIKMPSNSYVWVSLDEHKYVDSFVRFGTNDPYWIIDFALAHGSNVISEHDEGFYDD